MVIELSSLIKNLASIL